MVLQLKSIDPHLGNGDSGVRKGSREAGGSVASAAAEARVTNLGVCSG